MSLIGTRDIDAGYPASFGVIDIDASMSCSGDMDDGQSQTLRFTSIWFYVCPFMMQIVEPAKLFHKKSRHQRQDFTS
jgi:hypothetical protein